MKKLLFILTVFISTYSFSQTQREKDSTLIANGGAAIYLAFNGATVSGAWGGTIVAGASSLSTASKDSILDLAREYYQPFNTVVTRDSSLFIVAPVENRQMVVFSPDCASYGCGLLGASYPGAFYIGSNTASFINTTLSSNATILARATAHELGHDFGLYHQNSTGAGSGQIGYRPLMNGTITTINQEIFWSGTNENFSPQNDINIIAFGNGSISGIGVRLGDVGNTFNTARFLRKDQNIYSFIGVNDNDYYKIEIPSTQTVSIAVAPWSNGASNANATLDAAIDIYDADHNLIASSANTTVLNATLSQLLTAGTYYIRVRPDTGNANNPTGYGFMGHYWINYTF